MNLPLLGIISTIYLFHDLGFAVTSNSIAAYHPSDDFALNCGSSGNLFAFDGREWIGDIIFNSKCTSSQEPKGKSLNLKSVHQLLFVDPVPYMTARISRSQFTYTFQLRPGQKFIRLHFHPASYPGFDRSKALFTVKAGPYTLLSNFSASLAADALGVKYFAKEFCVNIEESQLFSITFSPSSYADDVYAFINGIEIVSMPAGLYYTPDRDLGANVVGKTFRFYIDNSTALELVHRLNIGGRSILSVEEDLGMYRVWSEDKNYFLKSDVVPVTTTAMIKYANIPTYTAPMKVYRTSWSMGFKNDNLTWKLPVDFGFRYLVRLHFCELESRITESGQRVFSIFIKNQIAETNADVMKWSGGKGVAIYRDYVVTIEGNRLEGKHDLIIALQPNYESDTDPILNGIEIFKLANPDNNLAGPNPLSTVHSPTSRTLHGNLVLAFGSRNVIATGVIFILTLLNIIVYQLNFWGSKSGEKNISSTLLKEGVCRRFSFAEIQLATNNFGDEFIIGKGGFGNVYKGLIDNQTKTVAIKRLKSESKQGADEFWMEIETLSTFRHVHLVSLIGYCDDSQEMLLVYEYMTNGTLADHLYKTRRNIDNNSPLSWEQRLNICIGSARGLAYLHTSRGANHGVIHRDVKSSNILLDKNWVAKISDFGLSKIENAGESHTHISTDVKGTFGYLDPEYFLTRRLTKKSDVYAFGVVLFEVMCGRPAVDVRLEEEQHSLALWAKRCITEGTLDQIIDPSVREQISPHCLKVFAEIASKCLHNNPNERLTMADVVAGLEYSLQPEEKAYSYIDQEIVLPGDASPQTSRHCTMQLTRRESVEDIASGTTKGKELCRRKEDYNSNRGPSWGRLWDLLWYKMRPPKAKPSPLPEVVFPLPELPCRRFSLAEIRVATNNFSKVIKDGPYSKVYMGYTDTMKKVSIEWLTSREQSVDEFCMEVRMLSQPQCTDVVSLVGYCYDELEMILVYEYMNNGTLFDRLHNTTNNSFLSLEERLRICIRAARGLNYLHTCAEQRIHGSISSSNILLDSNWIAKISNTGFLRDPMRQSFSHTRRLFLDTAIGYLYPEFWLTGMLTERTDVFAFGVVLFEVLSGRQAVDMELENEQRYLCKLARDCVHSGTVHQIIDPYLIGKISTHCLNVFVEIARNCVFLGGTERPQIHMSDVVRNLELALELQEIGDGQSWYSEESEIYSDEW